MPFEADAVTRPQCFAVFSVADAAQFNTDVKHATAFWARTCSPLVMAGVSPHEETLCAR